ncbi:MAG: redoxin domain-containing protein [Armatimonadota bacterium]|nr:peroxiredoxin family protein [bacterium]
MEEELWEPPVTIGEESMEQEVHIKPELGHLVPNFTLKSTDGKMISIWDYKERKNLILLFFNPENSDDLEALAEIRRRYSEIADENAEVLAIGSGPTEEVNECAASLNLPFPLMSDESGEVNRHYNVTMSSIFVVDKFGSLRMQSPISGDLDTTLNSAISTLDLVELECPECGVPTWPQEL